jgi:uncharacterized tellurite resistance protein B-like protein
VPRFYYKNALVPAGGQKHLKTMQFSGRELQAILKMANAMIMADGKVDKNEIRVMTTELLRFGVPHDHVEKLLKGANLMDGAEALTILASLDEERKKYVSSYLGTIMISDGDIDDKEMALWRLISTLCGFPSMNVVDAINNMSEL